MSSYADEGTIAHALAAMALEEGRPASAYINRIIQAEDYEHSPLGPSSAARWMRCPGSNALIQRIPFKPRKFSMKVTREMADDVQVYLDNLRQYAEGKELMIEQRLDISQVIGVPDHYGTADAIVVDEAALELQVHDLKFGRGVEVSAEGNEQLMIYAAAALGQFSAVLPTNLARVRLVIHQPRVTRAPSESVVRMDDLSVFVVSAYTKANTAQSCTVVSVDAVAAAGLLVPGEKQCRFCPAKATCPALAAEVKKTVFDDFESLDKPTPIEHVELARVLPILGLIEDWCTAVAAHAEALALRGEKVPGYKLVKGRAGARAWSDKDAAEEMLRKRFRLTVEQAYNLSLISPTQAEKLVKEDVIGEKQWQTLKGLVTQAEGKPTLVPESDKRPALEVTPVIDDFQEVAA